MKNIIMVLAVLICIGLAAPAAYCVDAEPQAQTQVSSKIMPKKVQVDSNFDGKVDRIETYDNAGKPNKIEADNDFDGIMDETLVYQNGKPYKTEKDTNKDGKPDMWIDL